MCGLNAHEWDPAAWRAPCDFRGGIQSYEDKCNIYRVMLYKFFLVRHILSACRNYRIGIS